MASAEDNRLAAARLMKVAAASRLPPATTRSQSSYTLLRTFGANYLIKGRFFS